MSHAETVFVRFHRRITLLQFYRADARRAALRNQALHREPELLGPMQNAPPGRAHGLVILPKPPPREAYSSILPTLRVAKVLEVHIDFEVLDLHGQPVDEELYDHWVVPLHKPEFQADLEQHQGLMELFGRALTFNEKTLRMSRSTGSFVTGAWQSLGKITTWTHLYSQIYLYRRIFVKLAKVM
eukprot:6212624-Pleurochrysis_carterae.AAC.2